MKETRIVRAVDGRAPREEIDGLGRILAEGGLVVFPTETVYGIAAAREDRDARDRLCRLKERPAERPLTVHLAEARELRRYTASLPPAASRLVRRLWPGPLTLVVPDSEGRPTGFRLPDHPLARALVRAAGTAVVASSANRSGHPPITSGEAAVRSYSGRVGGIITDGSTRDRAPSTVVVVEDSRISLLREGSLAWQRIRRAACFRVLLVCTGNLCRSPMAEGILATLLAEKLGTRVRDLVEHGLHILSAGTAGIIEASATSNAVRAAKELGADISGHRSRPLTPTLIEGADLIFVAEARHGETVRSFVPEAAGKTRMMLAEGMDLPDPIGQGLAEYRETAHRIRRAMRPVAVGLSGRGWSSEA